MHEKCFDINSESGKQSLVYNLGSQFVTMVFVWPQSISRKTRSLDIKYATITHWNCMCSISITLYVFTSSDWLNLCGAHLYASELQAQSCTMQSRIPNDIDKVSANGELIHFKELIVQRAPCPLISSDIYAFFSYCSLAFD